MSSNPATGEVLPEVAAPNIQDVPSAVTNARAAFKAWRLRSFSDRGDYLLRAARNLEALAGEIAQTITSEMGRPLTEALGEVKKSAAFLKFFAERADQALRAVEIPQSALGLADKSAEIQYHPRGVVALIKPWNAPVQQIVWGLGPALMAGCTVVVKPSEFTPRSALALQQAFVDAGIPQGVVTTVLGDRAVGAALVESEVDVVSFTGSRASGRKVAEAAGRATKKLILELSGKNTSIVDADCPDLSLVVPGLIYGAFSNCGQWCSSIERILLPESLYDQISAELVANAAMLNVGNGMDSSTDIGPVANERQLSIVSELIDEAISAGAKVLCGGSRLIKTGSRKALFYAPTILADVPAHCRINSENIFGPVVVLSRYSDLTDAISSTNATEYGLGTSFWTTNQLNAERVISESESGMVWINEGLQSFASCPWSVTKGSGYGTELGDSGFREFCFEKVIQKQFAGNDKPRGWYFPYNKS